MNFDLKYYSVVANYAEWGFGEFYPGWKSTLPAENWQNLWNSKPYKP